MATRYRKNSYDPHFVKLNIAKKMAKIMIRNAGHFEENILYFITEGLMKLNKKDLDIWYDEYKNA